jgi:4a-hydroxytetrahydrobiopterin dehydratase
LNSGLAAKTCTPCRGGIPPLTLDQATGFLGQAPGWALIEDGAKIEKRFKFTDFGEALEFVRKVGELAESEFHHPVVTFGWGFCRIELQTKKIKGLHENDFIMAAKINALAGA